MRLNIPLAAATSIVASFMIWSVPSCAEDAKAPSDLRTRLDSAMAQEVRDGFWGVVLVAQGGRIVLNEGYGLRDRKTNAPMTPDTVIDAGSLSKQVTATAALLLESQGKLSLEDPLSKYFEGVPAEKRNITLKQLLSHTGGVQEWVFPDDFTEIPREIWLQKVFAAPLAKPVGSGYSYSNDGVTLVAMAIEKVTGLPFQDYIRETFFKPLGMTSSGWYADPVFHNKKVKLATGYANGKDDGAPNEWPGPYWALLGNGGILWSAQDLLKWHKAIHGSLLPQSAREKLFTPLVEDPERDLYPDESAPMSYALSWRIGKSPCGDTRIAHTGTALSHHVSYRYYPERDILIYVASNKLDRDYNNKTTYYARRAAMMIANVFNAKCLKQ